MLRDLRVQKTVHPAFRSANQSDVLDPTTNSLAYLYFLSARLKAGKSRDDSYLLSLSHAFSSKFSNQVWIAPGKVKAFAQSVCAIAEPYLYANTATHFLTPIHAMLIKFTILSKHFSVVRPILDLDISNIKQSKFDLKMQDFLLYFYYGVIINSILCHDHVYLHTAPATHTSWIQIEAYRKCVLTNLLPLFTPPTTSRMLQTHCGAYQNWPKPSNPEQHRKPMQAFKATEVFGNYGLATRHAILGLTKTFLTLSILDITKATLNDGKGLASISVKDNLMVFFHDEREDFAEILKAMTFSKIISKEEHSLQISKEFIGSLTRFLRPVAVMGAEKDEV
ncbi:hypothetical protein BC829DRAFT_407143 [Chytridium lagenaria]|nr:hypothetical protein BC829DRAFT_407143 [Chytridium lagenaria]